MQAPKRRDHAPYLDVMTVQSRRYIAQGDSAFADHTKLLVEPIHVPDLNHTGITRAVEGAPTLFYPSGAKNVHFRQVIQASLAHGNELESPLGGRAASTGALPSVVQPQRPTLRHAMSLTLSVKVPGGNSSDHLYVRRDKKTAQHYKAKDVKTRDILATVRMNTTKITNLVNPHAT
ncbi:hypothetical protein SPRG_19580 [Saprolegnia parasitica CBS 223.65]|uniref:Uncharacterized protein n=1 Tax=Saprolegnia parasitica (strain CBS 223.65) TaxID=695850 RepID=A0A067CW73_SAPPC|nr:hypothetical protein SPRG_19580 [Saprolegnia parasitica CBS 223.65]KDO31052.1 hypothetical protein SPRG_19580 [Saprolegnia parasitica CBS 223.65]|eukprot:XP_012198313.1 hypothetical protein SPRG_19580 [Saprolegnia parasitica CBS 223.65]